jgi:PII-like signaling protein
MLTTGKALKVSMTVSEGATYHGAPASSSILDFLFYRGVTGATVLKGVAGFGADHHLHTSRMVEVSGNLPVRIEFVETREKVEELLGKLQEMCGTGLIETHETTVVKAPQAKKEPRPTPEHMKLEGKAQVMRIYVGESDRWNDKPLYEALVQAMRANDIAGVTVYKGILGYGAHRRVHRDKPLHLSRDASIMLSAIDTEAKLKGFLPVVEEMVQEGLVVMSDVDIIKYSWRPAEMEEPEESQG